MSRGIFVSHGRWVGDLVTVDIRRDLSSSERFSYRSSSCLFSLAVVVLFPAVLSVFVFAAVLSQDFSYRSSSGLSRVWLSLYLFLLSCSRLF